jgi:predicted ATPase
VLVSQTTAELLGDELPIGLTLRDLGERRLKDLVRPEHIFQLVAPELPEHFPALRTLDAYPHNLPVQLTSFIGREQQIADVKRLLGATRLLTLVGPGGSGKTRISLQAAAELLETFADGAWLVELAPLVDSVLVPQAVAGALGIRESGGRPVLEALNDHLRTKTLLLVLDNCEHLVEACAEFADHVLRAAPGLRILASSREGLGLAGENTYRVPSLGLPDLHHLPDLARLSQYEALRLFIDRATAVNPAFQVTNANAPVVAQLCHQLDGIPLAIELAAARVRSLSPEQIAARLDDRFRLLTGGNRTALPRHQTLRAAVDWSHALLTEAERVLFRRLTVFAGGWTLEAAEAVCANPPEGAIRGREGAPLLQPSDVLDLLDSLVNKSLVAGEPGDREMRYKMLETIRQYAQEKLREAGEGDVVRARHLTYFLDLAEAAEPRLRSAEQQEWLLRLDAEHDNMRAAMARALEAVLEEVPEAALRLAVALTRYQEYRGWQIENKTWLEQALAHGPPTASAARARALYFYAWQVGAETRSGEASRRVYDQAMAMAEAVGDTSTQAHVLMMRHHISSLALDHPDQPFSQALRLFEELGDVWGQANTFNHMGQVYITIGDLDSAERAMQQALRLWQAVGGRSLTCHALNELADMALLRGDVDRARALIDEALSIARALGHMAELGDSLHVSAQIAYRQADFAQMCQHYEQYQAIKYQSGDKLMALAAQAWLGLAAGIQGDYARARTLQEAVVAAYREVDAPFLIHWSEVMLAYTLVGAGEVAQASAKAERATQYFSNEQRIPDLCRAQWCLALAQYHLGDYERAGALLTSGMVIARDSHNAWAAGVGHYGLGRMALALGDTVRAGHELRNGLVTFQAMGARREIAETLEALAVLALREQKAEHAARWLGAAEALRESIGAPVPPVERAEHERLVAGTLSALNAAAFSSAWQDGRAMDREQAVMGALGKVGNSSAPTS